MRAKIHSDYALILLALQVGLLQVLLFAITQNIFFRMFILMFYSVCVGPRKNNFWALRGLEKALNFVLPKMNEPC